MSLPKAFDKGSVSAGQRSSQKIFALATLFILCLLAGCGGTSSSTSGTPPPPTAVLFQGKVIDGSHTVAGASVQLYAAGASGYGSASVGLLAAPVVTDTNGMFTVDAGSYTCASASTQVYLVATGGGVSLPAGASNASLAMINAWGNCGDLGSSSSPTINEVTTVAAVWALSPFMASMKALGASAGNQVGLTNAFLNAHLLADVVTGVSPSASVPANLMLESAKLYSLANVLASCTASSGGLPCSSLFAAVTAGTEAEPTNTIDAALRIVKNPSRNVLAIYQSGASVYAGLGAAPSDWTMSMTMTGGGLNYPTGVGVDSSGRAWVADYSGGVSAFTVAGAPVFASGLTASGLSEVFGLTIDPSGNVWVTSGGDDSVVEFSAAGTLLSGTGFSAGGISYPIAVASDSAGNIWVVNNGNGSVTKLSGSGTPASPTGYTGSGAFPVSVAVDAVGTPWIVSQEGAATHLSASGTLIRTVTCCAIPTSVAVDPGGDVWVADHYASAIVHVSGATGAILSSTTSGGLRNPNNLAVDGAGNIWAVNDFTGTLTEVAGSSSGSAGAALSPTAGYGAGAALQSPYAVAVDGSGNLWVSSYDSASLVRFIGLAAPVKTPLVGAPQLP